MTLISGKAYWASITAPNTTFEPCWTIDVALDEENYEKVMADGLTVKNKSDDRGNFVTIKRKVDGKNGPNLAPELVDTQRQPMFNYESDDPEDFEVIESGYTSDDDIPFAS